MVSLSKHHHALLADVVGLIREIEGIEAIVLGGSYARNRARPESDLDVGIYYRDADAFSIPELRSAAATLSDSGDPVVTDYGEWGPWANGGAWLSIRKQRVDLLYRSLDQVESVIRGAREGDYELHYGQQPPFGFFSPTYLGEVFIAIPLFDPHQEIERLKAEVRDYPEALRGSVIQNCLWGVEFGLSAFAPKFAGSADVYGVAGCLTRFAYYLVLAIFALNRTYLLNDKTALLEVQEFELVPDDFRPRLEGILANVGATVESLNASLLEMRVLFDETVDLAGPRYRPNRVP